MISPFAYGAVLGVSPLVLLLTALLGSALAGVAGVVLSAPITAIAMHSARALSESRSSADIEGRRAASSAADGDGRRTDRTR